MKLPNDSPMFIVANGARLEPGNLVRATGQMCVEQNEEWVKQDGFGRVHYTYERPFKPEFGSILMYLGFRPGNKSDGIYTSSDAYVLGFITNDRILNILYYDWGNYTTKFGGNTSYSDKGFYIGSSIDIGAAFIKLDI